MLLAKSGKPLNSLIVPVRPGAKLIISSPAVWLAFLIAALNEPAVGVVLLPLSLVVVTVKVAGMPRPGKTRP